MKTLSPLIISLLLASTPLSAFAEPQRASDFESFAFKFDYAPSELASEKGANKLLARLENAVSRKCDANRRMSVAERRLARDCIDRTMTGSIQKFGSTTLTQVYRSRVAG